jgi:hypothetical protein
MTTPSVVHKVTEWTITRKTGNPDTGILRGEWKKALKYLIEREKEVMTKDQMESGGAYFEACIDGVREHWRQGIGGFVDDGRVDTSD